MPGNAATAGSFLSQFGDNSTRVRVDDADTRFRAHGNSARSLMKRRVRRFHALGQIPYRCAAFQIDERQSLRRIADDGLLAVGTERRPRGPFPYSNKLGLIAVTAPDRHVAIADHGYETAIRGNAR